VVGGMPPLHMKKSG